MDGLTVLVILGFDWRRNRCAAGIGVYRATGYRNRALPGRVNLIGRNLLDLSRQGIFFGRNLHCVSARLWQRTGFDPAFQ